MKFIIFFALSFLLFADFSYANDPSDKRVNMMEELDDDVSKLRHSLDDANRDHFTMILQNYDLLAVTDIVKEDIGAAVKSCIKNHEALKPIMSSRHKKWLKAVEPVQKEARAHVDNMVAVQEYIEPGKIRALLKRGDDLRSLTSAMVKKEPITDYEACQNLTEKLSKTENNLITLLRSTMVSLPAESSKGGE